MPTLQIGGPVVTWPPMPAQEETPVGETPEWATAESGYPGAISGVDPEPGSEPTPQPESEPVPVPESALEPETAAESELSTVVDQSPAEPNSAEVSS